MICFIYLHEVHIIDANILSHIMGASVLSHIIGTSILSHIIVQVFCHT